MKKVALIVSLIIVVSTNLLAQVTGTISGKVIDAQTKGPLIGVNVLVLDTRMGASTDMAGNYLIQKVPLGTYRLRFDYIGYQSVFKTDVVVKVSSTSFVNAELTQAYIETEEVTVTAGYFVEEEKIQTSTIGLSREEIRRFPGGFEDVVRTVSTLPGVAINTSGGRNDLLVRGGGPSENLYIINNIEVPNINHFGTQGSSSGSLSFVNLDFVQDVTFSTGGFGAQFGDKMSSVISLTMTDRVPENLESKLTISATQYGFDLETPINNSGSAIFSARQSYLDLIFKAAGLPFIPVYTDFNFIFNYELSPKDKLFVLGLGAIDRINRDQSNLENRVTNSSLLDNTQNQWIGGLNYRRLLPNGYLDITFNSNFFQYRFNQIDEDEIEYFNSKADERELVLKAQNYWVASKSIGLRNGVLLKTVANKNTTIFADTVYDRSGNRVPFSSLGVPQSSITNSSAQKFAAFSEVEWFFSPKLDINTGIRFDYYGFLNHPSYFSPRLSIKYRLTEKHSFRVSGGIYYQSPSYVWVVNPINKNLKALQNQMGIIGWDFLAKNDTRFSLEGYYKRYLDLPTGTIPGISDYIVQTNTGTGYGGREDDFQSFGYFPMESKSTGRSYGLEFLMQKKFSEIPCYGLMSFTYNKTEVSAGNGFTYPGQYDQRFIFNLSGGYIFNEKWAISTKFRYFTGVPYTPVYRPQENPIQTGRIQNLPNEYLSARLPAGHHLDIRVDRYFTLGNTTLIAYLDIQNIYNYKIPVRPTYDFWENTIDTSNAIGILPSIGISLEF